MKDKKSTINIMGIMILSIFVMFIIEYYIVPKYVIKSMLKASMFLILPLIYIGLNKNINILDYFKIHSRRQFVSSIVLGISTFMLILGLYFMLKIFIDLSQIREVLKQSKDINKNNFIYVAIYISLVNSFLEEFFFRGFLFLSLIKMTSRRVAYLVSSLAFAIYHIGIMSDWFNIGLFLLVLVLLFAVGLFFNYLNEKNKNIYGSWLVHMFANFALNIIGLIMLGVI